MTPASTRRSPVSARRRRLVTGVAVLAASCLGVLGRPSRLPAQGEAVRVRLPAADAADGRPAPADRRRERASAPYAEPCPLAEPTCVVPALPREFRGVWVATVDNIDWPSKRGLSTRQMRRELVALLDRAQAAGMNAVVLQVRPAGDAIYRSRLEPWSEYLTGRQGRAPAGGWDPLAFAVLEAHARGMELHAWFNPYRARHPSAKGPLAPRHLARTRPELVRTYGTHLWMDPGEPDVRAHTIAVITDVVRRYDIDGVHFDDYFYPYKEKGRNGEVLDFPDSASYARYLAAGGTQERDDWRRTNVDRLVEELQRAIHAEKPWVKFGISPFGIWRPGYPAVVRGFDAYAELYADARKWLASGWVDYFTPQLYWPIAQPAQPYPALLRWWAEQNAFGRHLWPGNYTSRVGERSRTPWRAAEITAQVAVTRDEPGASGNLHFSMKAFLEDRDSLVSRLGRAAYAAKALVPPSPWLDVPPQPEPTVTVRRSRSGGAFHATLAPGAGAARPRWWAVQEGDAAGRWTLRVLPGSATEVTFSRTAARAAIRAVDAATIDGPPRVVRLRD